MAEMKPISWVLPAALENRELLQAARAQRVLRSWEEVVGTGLAKRSRPERYDRGTVWVAVEGSAWAQELRMRRDTLVKRLNTLAGEPGMFHDLRFGVRPLPPPGQDVIIEEHDTLTKETELSIREIAERRMERWRDSSAD